eukprot:1154891-Pelagomonas_calceolata.AAC.3
MGLGVGVSCPLTDSQQFVEPNGAGITNTICRAESAAIAAASCTLMHTLPQNVSPLFIKYVNNVFTPRSISNTFKEICPQRRAARSIWLQILAVISRTKS